MNLELSIALRYFFSKKTHNVINIISMICVGGIAVATAALVCTLSVYNGFQNLITDFYNTFDSDLRAALVQGKTFNVDDNVIRKLNGMPEVELATFSLEDNVLLRYKEKQVSITIKGVTSDYPRLTGVDSIIIAGKFVLSDDETDFVVLGGATATDLGVGVCVAPVLFYAPHHGMKVNLANPEKSFNEMPAYMSGVYASNQREVDSKFAFATISFVQDLLGYEGNEASVIEIRLKPDADIKSVQETVVKILGEKFKVQNKMEQHEEVYRMLKIEKWITFLILFFILVIAVVNVAGSLTMLIIEKREDARMLSNLGATEGMLRRIFLFEGWLVSVIGMAAGLVAGLVLCFVQKSFGLLRLGSADDAGVFLVDAYPVDVQLADMVVIMAAVLIVGFVVAWFPTRYVGQHG